jgi:hypothetical protein
LELICYLVLGNWYFSFYWCFSFNEIISIFLPVCPEGKGFFRIHPGYEVEEFPDVIRHFFIELHQRNPHRANPLAFPAGCAGSGYMHQAHQVEDEVVPHRREGRNPLGQIFFHDATGAETCRADIPTGITAEATAKLFSPEGPFIRYGLITEFVIRWSCLEYWRGVFPGEQGIEDQGFGVLTVEAFVQ